MTSKPCSSCKTELPLGDFYKWSRGKFGVSSQCKPCHQASNKKWVPKDPEYYIKSSRKYREQNREIMLVRSRTWREDNKDYDAFRQRERKALKKNAVPSWVGAEERFLIKEAYSLAQLRTKLTGFSWHVDHIVPLKHKDACGLHCIDNLQVIPWLNNLRKRNLYIG
jgi:hypothetical protein